MQFFLCNNYYLNLLWLYVCDQSEYASHMAEPDYDGISFVLAVVS